MRRHALAYEAVAGEEYSALKPALVKVQEAGGNFAFANEIKAPTSRDAFFKARARLIRLCGCCASRWIAVAPEALRLLDIPLVCSGSYYPCPPIRGVQPMTAGCCCSFRPLAAPVL